LKLKKDGWKLSQELR